MHGIGECGMFTLVALVIIGVAGMAVLRPQRTEVPFYALGATFVVAALFRFNVDMLLDLGVL
ncbi:hypothetical protein [Streptomyces sp. ODS05-4]|uniref:hypothetical protein n=1 Tax=Streptomyces sp. ODS05-4 TaxID=2944939 RepID=UPI00210F066A|nr:hypothetical protein [Streptomyces sp. ODS05-4]